jgi:pimeloyl-ACP methyl ester carboxylesterase
MPSVSVRGLDIAYEDLGAGDPVVFIPPTGAAGTVWLAQTMELSERYRCIVADNRDCGRSSYVEAPYMPADLGADIAGLMDALGVGAAHVVGYSLGGAAAQELAIARLDLVRSLVLVSTWAASDEWFKAQMRCWQALRCAHWDDDEAFWRAWFPWVLSPRTYGTPGMVEGLIAFATAQEPRQRADGFLRQCEADIVHDASEGLPGVDAPAIVIVGEEDICTPPRYAGELCDLLPQAELVVIPELAHAALLEGPAPVNAAISEFLAKH